VFIRSIRGRKKIMVVLNTVFKQILREKELLIPIQILWVSAAPRSEEKSSVIAKDDAVILCATI